jgi:hypothetical protein
MNVLHDQDNQVLDELLDEQVHFLHFHNQEHKVHYHWSSYYLKLMI